MDNNLVQILLVLILGGIATYDTVRSKRRGIDQNEDKSGEVLKLRNQVN